jgi:hypothetical protein
MATTTAIQIIKKSDESEDSSDSNDESKPSNRTNQAYRILVFIWAIRKGYHKGILLTDPPNTDMIDEK